MGAGLVWMVHGNLTGANIAPEGGEWALDWCGLELNSSNPLNDSRVSSMGVSDI